MQVLQGIYARQSSGVHAGFLKDIYAVQHMCCTAYTGQHMPCSTCAARHMLGCTAPHMPCSTFSHGICGCAARHKIVLHGICEVTLTRIVQKLPLMPWRNDICRVGVEWQKSICRDKNNICRDRKWLKIYMPWRYAVQNISIKYMPWCVYAVQTCAARHIWVCCTAYGCRAHMPCSTFTPSDGGDGVGIWGEKFV